MVGPCEVTCNTAADPYVGLLVSQVFRLEALVGLGTTGRVYRAQQLGFERKVAIKVIHRHLMQTAAVRDRFHREARLATRLTHPGIVHVLGSGELETQSDAVGGEVYLVSEFLEGLTLRQRLDSGTTVSLSDCLAFTVAIADAVGDAHAQRIIHRDLKPENLMSLRELGSHERHVVLDFGLARALDHQQDPLTHDGAILGTPQYMSPEAARGQPATPRSDVYALATILYELLAGRPLFAAESPTMVLMMQAEADPPPIGEHRNVPQPILDVLWRELSKAPQARSPEARSFALSLYLAASRSGLDPGAILLPQLSEEFLEQISATST